ncbi:protein translocase subunit SecDF [Chryseomicrobium excrementi]|uniref:Multifunctional fusion protein n=1 Tax=Chryseomicrobium excrementi TaxID=2041346 RepID=A0A2M9F205_9BACL|nr:protein translocase subunit SecDF [Chryseomicrobium excrementi]PJK17499.1 protein translocase subunit SecDF [Chryseomicrobium excrementi]
MKSRGRIVAFLLLLVIFAGTIGSTANGILKDIKLGLDLQGGFEVLYQLESLDGETGKISQETVADTAEALNNRINVLGVSEPVIQEEENNRIRVQLPGVEDQNAARELLSTEANLEFRDVNDELMLDGTDLVEGGAQPSFDANGQPIVTLKLKDPDKFAQVTEELASRPIGQNLLVIWLDFEEGVDSYQAEMAKPDPKFVSAPQVTSRIASSDVQIDGVFTTDETKNLAGILNAGALPVKLTEIYSTSVGAQFGEQALDSTVLAAIIGIALIFVFMLFYYRLPGFVAMITLSVYVYLILLVFELINGVLTLPGIAAIMLGVGMAVDANIITYERIKEELRVGKSVAQSFKMGAKQSFSAILDANVTTLLAAAVLFYFGTSSVKGFATMLIISILASFITAVWGSRLLLGLLVDSGWLDNKKTWFGISKKSIHPIENEVDTLDLPTKFDRIDFVGKRKLFYSLSAVLLATGIAMLAIFQLNLGIDFSSGTRVEILADQTLTTDEVRQEIEAAGHPSDDIVISGDESNIAVIRYNEDFTQEQINQLKTDLTDIYGIEPGVSAVSPTVGKELARNAIYALAIAMLGIIIYASIRFEWRMGLTAIISLLHDAFFMVAVFSILRLEVDITFIAAVLTIVGYSINDTIVTFDRIRENMARIGSIETEEQLAEVVNKSLRQTLGRSVNTVLTVVFVVVALIFFGAVSIQNFSIALLIGLIAGTYSSVFIAAQLWYDMKRKQLTKKGAIDVAQEKKQWGSDEPVV